MKFKNINKFWIQYFLTCAYNAPFGFARMNAIEEILMNPDKMKKRIPKHFKNVNFHNRKDFIKIFRILERENLLVKFLNNGVAFYKITEFGTRYLDQNGIIDNIESDLERVNRLEDLSFNESNYYANKEYEKEK